MHEIEIPEVSQVDEFAISQANERARLLQTYRPVAVSAWYDDRLGQVVIRLSSKLDIAFSPADAQGLEEATANQLEPIEISPSGLGIHFPKLDAGFYLPALLEGFLGSRKWMAARMGAAGGTSKSIAKTQAAKNNGRLGGRPKKAESLVTSRQKIHQKTTL